MAQEGVLLDRETFTCSICLDLLKEPVTIPCGHSYCLSCIKDHWDGEDKKGIHSCPQCRRSFTPRPELLKNTMLAAVVELLGKTRVQAAPAGPCHVETEDVACDVCTGSKQKALRFCLVCLVSYCDTHLQPHFQSPAFASHQLIEASKNLQKNMCSHHNKLMEMFCRSDQQCICYLCSVDEHKGHDIISAAAERKEKQKKLQESRQTIQETIKRREEDVKVLQQEVRDINLSADKAVEHSEKIYSELIRLTEKRSSDMKQQIRSQQEAEVSRVKELREKLEQEIAELRSKDAELQQLSHSEDHCHFLLNYSSASQLSGSTDLPSVQIRPRRYFEDVTAAVSESSQKIQELLTDTWKNISLTNMDVSRSAETKPRGDFLRYSRNITLDPNTANTRMLLSEGNMRATWMLNNQPHPDHPDRFRDYWQVLSADSLSGRHYFQVKIGEGGARIAVSYKNISRAADESRFGRNDKSWSLDCKNQSYRFWSNSVESPVPGPWSSTVGVFLDHPLGLLSFYSVSDTTTLLHSVFTSFTQPLHAGLWLYSRSSAELVKLG